MPFYKIGNVNYHYSVHGDKNAPPLVLISGLWAPKEYWQIALKGLSDYCTLIFDNRGIGKTEDDMPDETFTLHDMARDTIKLIEHVFEQTPVTLVGQSMGAAIAQCVAEIKPNLVSKLFLINGPADVWPTATLLAIKSIYEAYKNNAPFELIFLLLCSWVHGEQLLSDTKRMRELKQAMQIAQSVQTLHDRKRQLDAVLAFGGIEHARLNMPTFIVYGEEDLLSPPSVAEKLGGLISDSSVIAFPGAHGLVLEALPQFIALMKNHYK